MRNGCFLFRPARLFSSKDVLIRGTLSDRFERGLDSLVVLCQTLLYFRREAAVLIKAIAARILRFHPRYIRCRGRPPPIAILLKI